MKAQLYKYIIALIIFSSFPFIESNDDETNKVLVVCNKYTCPKNRGICNENNECICIKGYDTIDDLSRGDFYCNYRKKSKLIAFLLEFVLGFGSGHFYLGRTTLATIKMIYTSLTCLIFCQFHSIQKITELKRFATPLETTLLVGWAAWQILDGVLIGFGFLKDRNGYELRGW